MVFVKKELLRLSLPLLATMLIEPILLATDSAFVGQLGTAELAGLTLASTLLSAIVGLCIFLSYATTASVSQAWGAKRERQAYELTFDAIWSAVVLGLILAIGLGCFATNLVAAFGPNLGVASQAASYLRASAFGLPGMLAGLALGGALRGMGDTKTPLWATSAAAISNILLSWFAIYVLQLGIAGAGYATAFAQSLMGLIMFLAVLRKARTTQAVLAFQLTALLRTALAAWPLLLRTLSLRATLLLQVAVATALGEVPLSAHQLVATIWAFESFAIDSLSAAAMILVGQGIGRKDVAYVRQVQRGVLELSLLVVLPLSVTIAVLIPWLIPIWSNSLAVQQLGIKAIWVACLCFPLAAWAFPIDGILMTAKDTKFLALVMLFSLLSFLPAAGVIMFLAKTDSYGIAGADGTGLLWLWAAYGIFPIGVRAMLTQLRLRGTAWMHLAN